jgi:hypothetical protein
MLLNAFNGGGYKILLHHCRDRPLAEQMRSEVMD